MITIKTNANEVGSAFLRASKKTRGLKTPMWKSVLLLERALKVYPPPPMGSSYSRTGRLGGAWETSISGGGRSIKGVVENTTDYVPFVQGKKSQAWMHRGRWLTDEGAVQKHRKEIEENFAKIIRGIRFR